MSKVPLGKITALWKARWLFSHPQKTFRVFRDRRTPFLAKALPIIAVIYIFLPIDVVADFVPLLGQLDDAAIVLGLVSIALNMVPDAVFRDVGLDARVRDSIL